MQLLFLLLWLLALILWLTIMYFIRTQIRPVLSIRENIPYIYYGLVLFSGLFFLVAFWQILTYAPGPSLPASLPSPVQPTVPSPSSPRSTNDRVF